MGTEGDFLKLLSQAELPASALAEILGNPVARKYHAVRLALAAHPRTPLGEALSLVGTLFWRDLAHLSANARVHPQVRRAADRDLLRRLPEMALAERVDLARCVGRGVLLALRFDEDPRVVDGVLNNRLATEGDIVQAAAFRQAPPEVLAVIAVHPRWISRPAIRGALLRNPNLPAPVALGLLKEASGEDLRGLRDSPTASRHLRACAERVLAEREERV